MSGPIVLRLAPDEPDSGFLQGLAGETVWSARPLLSEALPAALPPLAALPSGGGWREVYDGPGLLEGRIQRIAAAWRADGWRRVVFADGETYLVAPGGDRIERTAAGAPGPAAPAPAAERALGAPLALALAQRGAYLLHASCVVVEGRAVALTAPSGGGKSTLAAAARRLGWPRIADDQLAVRLGVEAVAFTRFPQLKLAPGEGAPAELPAALPLCALIEVRHGPTARAAAVELFAAAEAALALTRATVASRLFDDRLLADHFDACVGAARGVAVARLAWPSGLEHLPAALDALLRFVRGRA